MPDIFIISNVDIEIADVTARVCLMTLKILKATFSLEILDIRRVLRFIRQYTRCRRYAAAYAAAPPKMLRRHYAERLSMVSARAAAATADDAPTLRPREATPPAAIRHGLRHSPLRLVKWSLTRITPLVATEGDAMASYADVYESFRVDALLPIPCCHREPRHIRQY